jgi:hypothetical protein
MPGFARTETVARDQSAAGTASTAVASRARRLSRSGGRNRDQTRGGRNGGAGEIPRGSVAASGPADSSNGTAVSRPADKPGTASGAGLQIVANSQLWAAPRDTARVIVGVWRCSGIRHSCCAAFLDRPRQATVPRTGWSWNISRRAVSTAFMGGTLASIQVESKHRQGAAIVNVAGRRSVPCAALSRPVPSLSKGARARRPDSRP